MLMFTGKLYAFFTQMPDTILAADFGMMNRKPLVETLFSSLYGHHTWPESIIKIKGEKFYCHYLLSNKIKMAERTGLEPATPCVTGRYSNQLNYQTVALSGCKYKCVFYYDKNIFYFFYKNRCLLIKYAVKI